MDLDGDFDVPSMIAFLESSTDASFGVIPTAVEPKR